MPYTVCRFSFTTCHLLQSLQPLPSYPASSKLVAFGELLPFYATINADTECSSKLGKDATAYNKQVVALSSAVGKLKTRVPPFRSGLEVCLKIGRNLKKRSRKSSLPQTSIGLIVMQK
uniref:Uncharacterized protein n=1 Tax=Anopheles albimanus TaxID=7167 RepID=A0A8W7K9Z4_ANOAL